MQQQATLEMDFLKKLSEQASQIRATMATELTMEAKSKAEALDRNKALVDALDNLRERNQVLEDTVSSPVFVSQLEDAAGVASLAGEAGLRRRRSSCNAVRVAGEAL